MPALVTEALAAFELGVEQLIFTNSFGTLAKQDEPLTIEH